MTAPADVERLRSAARALAVRTFAYLEDPTNPGAPPPAELDCDVEMFNLADEVLVALGEESRR